MKVPRAYGMKSAKCESMPPLSQHACGECGQMTPHEWRGYPVEISVSEDAGSRLIEIAPLDGVEPHQPLSLRARGVRLRRAADIALDLDTSLSRLVQSGRTARFDVKPPRLRPVPRLYTTDEALALRPSVEELVAPLIFDSDERAPLRPFQEAGAQWLVEHRIGILADDMGLGKTAQALRALERLVDETVIRSALVVCPKSLLANWEAECERWVPRLTVVRSVPAGEESDRVWSALLGRAHIIVTSYEQLRPLPLPLMSQPVELVIADEAHRLRRAQAKLVREFRLMNAERMWALTGTPMERHPVDLATLLSLLEPTRFSAKTSNIDMGLRALAEPYLLRRLKTDVLRELPEVIDTKEIIELTTNQQRAYSRARSQPLPKEFGEVLQRLTLLRSICDAEPSSGASAKIDRILEILQAVQDAGEKAVVFSYTLRPLEILLNRMTRERPPLSAVTLTGKLTTAERARAIQRFKSDATVVALLCSSRVGGEGLTLTEANHVIFINEWWNPSANAQARDRVVRLGQERIVHVRRFRSKDTVEEALDQILDQKSENFANIVDALAADVNLKDPESKPLLAKAVEQITSESQSGAQAVAPDQNIDG